MKSGPSGSGARGSALQGGGRAAISRRATYCQTGSGLSGGAALVIEEDGEREGQGGGDVGRTDVLCSGALQPRSVGQSWCTAMRSKSRSNP